jgi:hypothetical protein
MMGAVRNDSQKLFKKNDKRGAIELWKAQVPLSKIRAQLKMSESTLRMILAFAFDPINPIDPIASMPNRMQEVIDRDGGMTKY